MSIYESILVALFCMAVVFFVLGILYFLIRIFSLVLGYVSKPQVAAPVAAGESAVEVVSPQDDFSAGTLVLKDTDEQTAAMIMAIISHESGIPLSELCFKSIRLINKESEAKA
ncbi:MAG: OadG family protein [Clostridiaceae bacterium]|nr:OadG family protein [Clostridiaceae bacterium]